MRTYSVAFLSPLLFFLALPVQAVAQSAAPASVPDQMPFDITYGEPVTAAEAEAAVRRVVGEAMKAPRNWKLAVAVTDPGGELVYLYRMDQTQIGSVGVAINKARTAARFRRTTEAFARALEAPGGGVVPKLDGTLVASPGGFPIMRNGRIVGGIGCSGALSSQDHAACRAGAVLGE